MSFHDKKNKEMMMFPYQFLSMSATLKTKSTSNVPAQNSMIFKIHEKTYIIVWSQQCPLTAGREKSNLSQRGEKNQNSNNEEKICI